MIYLFIYSMTNDPDKAVSAYFKQQRQQKYTS